MLISNELPQLGDASAGDRRAVRAAAALPLLARAGKTTGSSTSSTHELPGILNWALDGLDAPDGERDAFTRRRAADEAMITLQDLASPVAAFVRDRCLTGPDHTIAVDAL